MAPFHLLVLEIGKFDENSKIADSESIFDRYTIPKSSYDACAFFFFLMDVFVRMCFLFVGKDLARFQYVFLCICERFCCVEF